MASVLTEKNLHVCTENSRKFILLTDDSQHFLRKCHYKVDPSQAVSQVECRGGNRK